MFQLVAQTTATHQAAQAGDGVTNFFLVLAAAAFAVVILRLIGVGELGGVIATVGGALATVALLTLVALLIFIVFFGFNALLTF